MIQSPIERSQLQSTGGAVRSSSGSFAPHICRRVQLCNFLKADLFPARVEIAVPPFTVVRALATSTQLSVSR